MPNRILLIMPLAFSSLLRAAEPPCTPLRAVVDNPISFAETPRIIDLPTVAELFAARSVHGEIRPISEVVLSVSDHWRALGGPKRVRVRLELFVKNRPSNPNQSRIANDDAPWTPPPASDIEISQTFARQVDAPIYRALWITVFDPDRVRLLTDKERQVYGALHGSSPKGFEESVTDRDFLEGFLPRRRLIDALKTAARITNEAYVGRFERVEPWMPKDGKIQVNLAGLAQGEFDAVVNLIVREFKMRAEK